MKITVVSLDETARLIVDGEPWEGTPEETQELMYRLRLLSEKQKL